MIQTLKRKFIVTAMIAVTVLLTLLLGAVNAVNAWTTAQDSARLLENLVQMVALGRENPFPGGPGPEGGEALPAPTGEGMQLPEGEPPLPRSEGRGRGFMSEALTENDRLAAVYFCVWSRGGAVLRTDVGRISDVSQEQAAELAQAVLEAGKTEGRVDNFRYTSMQNPAGETVYVFLENSTRRNAVLRVAVLSLVAGLGGWLLMLALVVLLSKRAIAPIAENMERQRRFVTDAGHELKTPLAIIQANTEAMELIAGGTKWSRNIKVQTQRLTELTTYLLILARGEELPAQGSFAALNFSALVEKTAQMFQAPMERKGLKLKAQTEGDLTLRGSESQLGTLCSILFDNAVKYAAEGSVLRLSLRRGEKTCTLRLENCCDKLPDCPPERLFDRFFRGDESRNQNTGGFGIGLSAARAIVLQHRGRLEAEYPAADRVAFTVTLPL